MLHVIVKSGSSLYLDDSPTFADGPLFTVYLFTCSLEPHSEINFVTPKAVHRKLKNVNKHWKPFKCRTRQGK